MIEKRILLLFAHPAYHKSRVNRYLLAAAKKVEGVYIHDLYEEYPDFHIDVAREQALLLEHDLIVFQHPFYWYSCPALLKEWLDLVLQHGFAFGDEATALRGKWLLTATTTGGRAHVYQRGGMNHYTMREFLVPFERTASLCGMHYLPPFIVHGTRATDGDEALIDQAHNYGKILARLRDEHIDAHALDMPYINDLLGETNSDA